MKFEEIDNKVGKLFGIGSERGKILYDFIKDNNIQNILELGFANGKSTCYMAAALKDNKKGLIETIDLKEPNKSFGDFKGDLLLKKGGKPKLLSLIDECKFNPYINPIFSEKGYNWELMKIIEKRSKNNICEPLFDFCFIDGAHCWDVEIGRAHV